MGKVNKWGYYNMPTTNMMKLAIRFAAQHAIPEGGNVVEGVRWLADDRRRTEDIKMGQTIAKQSVDAIRNAREPNPYATWDDEAIAELILEQIDSLASKR